MGFPEQKSDPNDDIKCDKLEFKAIMWGFQKNSWEMHIMVELKIVLHPN